MRTAVVLLAMVLSGCSAERYAAIRQCQAQYPETTAESFAPYFGLIGGVIAGFDDTAHNRQQNVAQCFDAKMAAQKQ